MFTVKDKETGETYVVYAVDGLYFLTYDEDLDRWYAIEICRCIPVKGEEVL